MRSLLSCYIVFSLFFLSIIAARHVSIDSMGREFDAIGAISGGGGTSRLLYDYEEPIRSQILDMLFIPNKGGSLHLLKVEIGGDSQSTEASEASHMHTRDEENYNRGYEWWMLAEAKKRNPDILIYALAWAAPGWIGNGTYFSQDCIDYLIKWVKGAKRVHNIDVDFLGVWNERDGGYEEAIPWVKLLRKNLDSSGLRNVKIVAPDYNWNQAYHFALNATHDTELLDSVYAFGAHYAFTHDTFAPSQIQALNKKIWASECSNFEAATWEGGLGLASMLNGQYIKGNVTGAVIWCLTFSWFDYLRFPQHGLLNCNEPWSGHYDVPATLPAIAHTTQFVMPGWQYFNLKDHLMDIGSAVLLVSPSGSDASFIIETYQTKSSTHVTFELPQSIKATEMHVWRTTENEYFKKQQDVTVSSSSISLSLEPAAIYSITTLKTPGWIETHTIAPSKPFPLPYAEDFERYVSDATVKYFTDQAGSFSAQPAPLRGSSDMALKQEVPLAPIPWHYDRVNNVPFTVIGDASWTDYAVKVDAFIPEGTDGYVYVTTRMPVYSGTREDDWPRGYSIQIFTNGTYFLASGEPRTVLKKGSTTFPAGSWHDILISVSKSTIDVSINDKAVVTAFTDSKYTAGAVGLGSGFHYAYFDDFKVYPV